MSRSMTVTVWPIFHRVCGEVAFYTTYHPFKSTIKSGTTLLFDGTTPEPNSVMRCESCRDAIKKQDLLATQPPRKKLILIPQVVH